MANISLEVTVTYTVHPRKEEEQNRFHAHGFHQILNLLRGEEKRRLSNRSMFLPRGIRYTPSEEHQVGSMSSKLDAGSGYGLNPSSLRATQ